MSLNAPSITLARFRTTGVEGFVISKAEKNSSLHNRRAFRGNRDFATFTLQSIQPEQQLSVLIILVRKRIRRGAGIQDDGAPAGIIIAFEDKDGGRIINNELSVAAFRQLGMRLAQRNPGFVMGM